MNQHSNSLPKSVSYRQKSFITLDPYHFPSRIPCHGVLIRMLQLLDLGRVFNSRCGCVCATQLHCFETKLPNVMLKTRPKQLLGYLRLNITLPELDDPLSTSGNHFTNSKLGTYISYTSIAS
jgi:hypothetical protein